MHLDNKISQLLKNHHILEKKLVQIPLKRSMNYHEDEEDGLIIGKPRFDIPFLVWDPDLLVLLRNHLQEIWNIFDEFSYWFDDQLKELLLHDQRRLSKKSVLFLLERDVWETDEVFGAYLIEGDPYTSKISYYRFSHRYKTFEFSKMNYTQREDWIRKNAIHQIQKNFKFIWKQLENEILACRDDQFKRTPPIQLSDTDLRFQYRLCKELLPISKEATLLMLGRLEELWLLKILGKTRVPKGELLLPLAECEGILTSSNKKLFNRIRTHYNHLKHDTTYDVNSCNLESLTNQFGKYIKEDSQ